MVTYVTLRLGKGTMRKVIFLVGGAIGFILGSRAGKEPYQQVETKLRQFVRRPEVQQAVNEAQTAAQDTAGVAVAKVGEKLSSTRPEDTETISGAPTTGKSYADPQDLQFGAAAAEKEETVDEMLKHGMSTQKIEEMEEQLPRTGDANAPRAGNKAPLQDRT